MTERRTISDKFEVDEYGLWKRNGERWDNVFSKKKKYFSYMDTETKIGLSVLGGVIAAALIICSILDK